jgi:hypothetical protein
MANGDLVSAADASLWLGNEGGDVDMDVVGRLITAVSWQIQNFLSYDIASQTYSRTFNGRGGDRLMVPDYPVTAVQALSVDGVAIPPAQSQTDSGYVCDGKATIYLRGYTFNRGVQNVALTYVAGYAVTPPDIVQACLEWVKTSLERMDRAANVTMLKAGVMQVEFGGDVMTSGRRMVAPMPPAVYALLQPYARVFPA